MKIENPRESCNLGQGSVCCAYLVCGPDGFECVNGTSTGNLIKTRLYSGTMNAKGTGDWKECLFTKGEKNVN